MRIHATGVSHGRGDSSWKCSSGSATCFGAGCVGSTASVISRLLAFGLEELVEDLVDEVRGGSPLGGAHDRPEKAALRFHLPHEEVLHDPRRRLPGILTCLAHF